MNTVWCIACSFCLGLIFRVAANQKIDLVPLVLVNYLVCSVIAFSKVLQQPAAIINTPGLLYSGLLGILFFFGFTWFAKSIQEGGLPIAVLFQKLSLVLSVPFAVFLGDTLQGWQMPGIILSCISIYFLQKYPNRGLSKSKTALRFLLASLFISAAIECTFIAARKVLEWSQGPPHFFIGFIFVSAFITGILYFAVRRQFHHAINRNVLITGLALGIPNYYSIHFMLEALNTEWQPSVFYTILNIALIVISCFAGVFIFKDNLSPYQWLGLVLSILSLTMLTGSQL
ncbi:MAG: EamA family transporter [Saprospiraceae bacterium]|nr:EamA family transporter [Saprospiraceae bacterium]